MTPYKTVAPRERVPQIHQPSRGVERMSHCNGSVYTSEREPGGAFLRRRISEQAQYQQSQDRHKHTSVQQPTLLDRVNGQHSPGPTKESLEHDLRVLSRLRTDIVTGRHPFYKAPAGVGPDSLPQRPASSSAPRTTQPAPPGNGVNGPSATGSTRTVRPGRRDSRDVANDYKRQDKKMSFDDNSPNRAVLNDNSKRPFSSEAAPASGTSDGNKRTKTTDVNEISDIRARISEKHTGPVGTTSPRIPQDAAEERPLVLRLDASQAASEKEDNLRATSMRRSVSAQSASARSRSLAAQAHPNRRESIRSVDIKENAALSARPATIPSAPASVPPLDIKDVAVQSRKARRSSPVAAKANRKASPTISKATPAHAVNQDKANVATRAAGYDQSGHHMQIESDKARQDRRERERRRALPRVDISEPPPRRDPSKFDKQRLPPAAGHPPRDARLTKSTGAPRDASRDRHPEDDRAQERIVARGRSDSDRQGARSPGPRDRHGRGPSPDRLPYGTRETDQRTLSARPGSLDGQSAQRSAEADMTTNLSRSRSQQARSSPPTTRISDRAPPALDARQVHGDLRQMAGAAQEHALLGRDSLDSKPDNRSAQLNGRASPAPLRIQDGSSPRYDTAGPVSAPVTKYWPPKDDPDRERPPPVKPFGKNARSAERIPSGPKALPDAKGNARQLSPTVTLNTSSAKTPTLQDRIAQTALDARDPRNSPPRSARDIVPPPRASGKPEDRDDGNAVASHATSSANEPHMSSRDATQPVSDSLFSRLNRSNDSGTMPPIQTDRNSLPDRSASEYAGRSYNASDRLSGVEPADTTDTRVPSKDRSAELSASALRNRISLPDQRQTDKGRQYDREREAARDRPLPRQDQRLDRDRRRSPSPVPSLKTSYSEKGRSGPPQHDARVPLPGRERGAQAPPPAGSQRGHERRPSDIDSPSRDPFVDARSDGRHQRPDEALAYPPRGAVTTDYAPPARPPQDYPLAHAQPPPLDPYYAYPPHPDAHYPPAPSAPLYSQYPPGYAPPPRPLDPAYDDRLSYEAWRREKEARLRSEAGSAPAGYPYEAGPTARNPREPTVEPGYDAGAGYSRPEAGYPGYPSGYYSAYPAYPPPHMAPYLRQYAYDVERAPDGYRGGLPEGYEARDRPPYSAPPGHPGRLSHSAGSGSHPGERARDYSRGKGAPESPYTRHEAYRRDELEYDDRRTADRRR